MSVRSTLLFTRNVKYPLIYHSDILKVFQLFNNFKNSASLTDKYNMVEHSFPSICWEKEEKNV